MVGVYQSRPDGAGIEFASPTGLAALDGNGLLVSGYIGAPDGVIAFGRTTIRERTRSHGGLWVVRGSVDAMVQFSPDSGLATTNTDVQWRRIDDHVVRPLAPGSVPTGLVSNPAEAFAVLPASAVGELVTR